MQQYFGKIKAIEEPVGQRTTTLNQEAAARVLKADLVSILKVPLCALYTTDSLLQSDNKALSNRLAEKIAEERAKALLKSVEGRKRPADESAPSSADDGKSKKSKHKHKTKGKSRR